MTLLVARQCRLLRAPHAAVGALRRLQQPAATVAARSYAVEAAAKRREANERNPHRTEHSNPAENRFSIRRQDPTQYKKPSKEHLRELTYLLTPKIEDSNIVPVNSAIIIPASVAAAVGVRTVLVCHVLIPIETRTLRREARAGPSTPPLGPEPCRLPRHPFICPMAP